MFDKAKKPRGLDGELELLRRIRTFAGARQGALRLGIGDDCAILRPKPGEEIAVTTDLSLDGRHFRLAWHPPDSVGHRVLARGLSDLAAMGARPLAAFLSLGLPTSLTASGGRQKPWVDRFYGGLLSLAKKHNVPLAGGDLAESPMALADIVLMGGVPRGRGLLRSTARPGDGLYVTGSLGGASVGLVQLSELGAKAEACGRLVKIPKRLNSLLQPHLYPQPRIAQGLWLQTRRIASAAIDISDGLSTDLAHLCEESGVAAELDAASLPIAAGARIEQALHGGEDYELLFTARPGACVPRSIAGVPISRIGQVVRRRSAAPQIVLRTATGLEPLDPQGWEHFSAKAR